MMKESFWDGLMLLWNIVVDTIVSIAAFDSSFHFDIFVSKNRDIIIRAVEGFF